MDKSKESKLVKKVKSLDQQEQKQLQREKSIEEPSSPPPIPPIRESSVKREEIKWVFIEQMIGLHLGLISLPHVLF